MYLLSGQNITCGYNSMDIVFDCNIGVNKGEIACIVGPNGAGKSTVMKSLFGLIGIRKGKVLLDGEDITNMLPQERVLKGMGFVPQTNNIFPSLSVQENLEMGAFIENNDPKDMLDYIYGLFPILHDKVLMLDEPSAGVSPIVMEGIFNKIQEIAKQGTAVLMVEQNAKQALEISDLGFVLNQGKNLFTNTGKSLLDNKEVRKSFLGG